MQDFSVDPISQKENSAGALGSNQSGMRAHNERLVLTLVRRHGALAKAEIARMTGLSAQTVSVIMRALEDDGLLVRGNPVRGKVGQPSIPMRLASDGAYFLGLKVGRRSSEVVLCDFLGKVKVRRARIYAYPTPESTASFALQAIDEVLGELSPARRDRVAGAGIAMPFFLWNWATALDVPEQKMAGWHDADIRAIVARHFDFPVYLENDASAACGAELVFGPADGPRDFLYFYVGFFIGGGLVLNGRLFSGAGNAGALGPMPVVTREGGTQQLIDVASLFTLERRLRALGHDTSELWESTEAWHADREALAQWTDTAAEGLAHAIVSACSLIDFRAVKIDGWLPAALKADLVAAVSRHLDRHDLSGLHRPEILPGSVGPDARTLGAASLPLSRRYLIDVGS